MAKAIYIIMPLVVGYLLDLLLGDPETLPHPIRLFGWLIKHGERLLNRPAAPHTASTALAASGSPASPGGAAPVGPPVAFLKGMAMTLVLCGAVYLACWGLLDLLEAWSLPLYLFVSCVGVFYGLANRQLIIECVKVFTVLGGSGGKAEDGKTGAVDPERLDAARIQLSRIVGRDTSKLSPQQIRIAVLETMSENLGDGVVAPLFYFALAGVPGMLTYKMVNTLDSMIGYRNERYEQFGKFAARLDDLANFIPARLTALLMVAVAACLGGNFRDARRGAVFMRRYGHQHKSPNAGYPEAALAGILDCRFGGANIYHGILVVKPYIGYNNRLVSPDEITRVSRINNGVCLLMVALVILFTILNPYA